MCVPGTIGERRMREETEEGEKENRKRGKCSWDWSHHRERRIEEGDNE